MLSARVGDAACNNLHCGDEVILKSDRRHVGHVQLIHWGTATVRWIETGWLSEVDCSGLEKAW